MVRSCDPTVSPRSVTTANPVRWEASTRALPRSSVPSRTSTVPVGVAPSLRITTETGTGVPCRTLRGTTARMVDVSFGVSTTTSTTWARSPVALWECRTSRSVSVASAERCTVMSVPGWSTYHRVSGRLVASDSNHTGGSNGSTVNGFDSSTMPLGDSAYGEYIETTNVGVSPGVMPTDVMSIGTTTTLLSNTEVSRAYHRPLTAVRSTLLPR